MTVHAFLPGYNGIRGLQYLPFNRFSGPTLGSNPDEGYRNVPDSSEPPPNVWGDKLFLVKFQVGLGEMPPSNMMLYDRKRSFQVFMLPQDNTELFSAFFREMTGPRGGHGGLKMYRWARRTGNWQFSVCLDREPLTDTKW